MLGRHRTEPTVPRMVLTYGSSATAATVAPVSRTQTRLAQDLRARGPTPEASR
jgi:hypothetical protein